MVPAHSKRRDVDDDGSRMGQFERLFLVRVSIPLGLSVGSPVYLRIAPATQEAQHEHDYVDPQPKGENLLYDTHID